MTFVPSTSGLYNFNLSNAGIIVEAFDRIGIRPPELTRHHMHSARVSLNLELAEWADEGFNFWQTLQGTIPLVINQSVYTFPSNLVTLTDLFYSAVNGGGAGINQDRMMTPIARDQYLAITNKNQPGIPTQYWFQMAAPIPQVTIWQVPSIGYPQYQLGWAGLSQMQDANIASGEIPNVAYRALPVLCAKMAFRLCEKFGPTNPMMRTALMQEKKMLADYAWEMFVRRDQEPGSSLMRPNVSSYARMRL